jgi:hypothetical protein
VIDVIRRTDGDEEIGSIGIGAMIVFIALILVAAVASTIIIKTAEELQQNAESTSQDTRKQLSGKVSVTDVYVKTIANPLHVDDSRGGGATDVAPGDPCGPGLGDCLTDVATLDVIARISSGSLDVQEGDIRWYVTCKVTFVQWTPDPPTLGKPTETLGTTTYAVVDTALADARALSDSDGTPDDGGDTYTTGDAITAGTTFRFEIGLSPTNADDEAGAVNEDVEAADFATAVSPGCDAEAGAGQELALRIVVDGGGETLATLKITSIDLGTSVL